MVFERFPQKSTEDKKFAAFVVVTGLVIGIVYVGYVWAIGDNGFAEMPYRDFSNLWAGSKLALDGNVALLFEIEAYRAALRTIFWPELPDQEWSYPPSILIFGMPLALLPVGVAYGVWTAGTIALLHFSIRPLGLSMPVHLAALFSPAVFMNALFGQNGALTAALLIGGLLATSRRPILAGILLGLLTIKPHLGLLIPFCLIASRNWSAFASAVLTASTLVLLTGFLYGFDVWQLFVSETRPLMTAIMEAPYPTSYQANALTVFIMARSLGAGLEMAYLVQGFATALAIGVAFWLWLPSTAVDSRRRALLTATLAIVATPYGYTYDTIPICVALAYAFSADPKPRRLFMALAWFFPFVAHLLILQRMSVGALMPVGVAILLAIPILRHGDMHPLPVKDRSSVQG